MSSTDIGVGGDVRLTESIREALLVLYDPPALATTPLVTDLIEPGAVRSSRDVADLLREAIENLKPIEPAPPQSHGSRCYRYLRLRYVECQGHTAIARELGISIRQASRVHLDALEALARVLFPDRFRSAPPDPAAREPLPSAQIHHTTRARQSLEAELASVGPGVTEGNVDLVEVTTSVRDTCGRFAAAHGVSIEIDLPGPLPPVKVNRVALRQIQLNLLIYLVELIRRRSAAPWIAVSIRGERSNGGVVLTMAWHGEILGGSDRATRDSSDQALFDAASYLARLQGVRVEKIGDGETELGLSLWLPVSDLRSILVVDDNPDVGKLFARMLAKNAYNVVQARSVGRALSVARENPPEAILLDVVMPSRDGWELLATLKGDPKLAEIPVIVCSVLPDRELALSLGAADFLPKPVTRSTLQRALGRLFEAAVMERG